MRTFSRAFDGKAKLRNGDITLGAKGLSPGASAGAVVKRPISDFPRLAKFLEGYIKAMADATASKMKRNRQWVALTKEARKLGLRPTLTRIEGGMDLKLEAA